MANLLSSSTIRVLERGLDIASYRHQILANNVANVDTPGFKRSGIDFAQTMAETMRAIDHGAPVSSTVQVAKEEDTVFRNDGNNVDIEREMAELAENYILYNAMSQMLSSRYAQLRSIITEGRR